MCQAIVKKRFIIHWEHLFYFTVHSILCQGLLRDSELQCLPNVGLHLW